MCQLTPRLPSVRRALGGGGLVAPGPPFRSSYHAQRRKEAVRTTGGGRDGPTPPLSRRWGQVSARPGGGDKFVMVHSRAERSAFVAPSSSRGPSAIAAAFGTGIAKSEVAAATLSSEPATHPERSGDGPRDRPGATRSLCLRLIRTLDFRSALALRNVRGKVRSG